MTRIVPAEGHPYMRLDEVGRPVFDHEKIAAAIGGGLTVDEVMDGRELRACSVCGCTDARACPGGCYWVAPDLCSRCLL